MADEINEIKNRLDIVDFIQTYATLKKAGNNWKGLCPFHNEKTPSLMVSREKQIFKCFGCGEGGSVFDFLMKIEGLEFREALEILASRTGVTLPKRHADDHRSAPQLAKNRLHAANQQAARFFHTVLVKHPSGQAALAYLKDRGVDDQSIKKYLLGYAPNQSALHRWLTKQGFSDQEIKAAGQPDRFFNRVMFPFHDLMGNIIGFSGRALTNEQQPKYLHTAETDLFRKSRYLYGLHQARSAIRATNSAVIVEGQLDVILSAQAGIAQVVAPSGTALTDDQLRLLHRLTENILLGFDQDPAGVKATDEAVAKTAGLDLSTKVITLPQSFKDAGELVKTEPNLWAQAVDHALSYVEWVLGSAAGQSLTIEIKKNLTKRLLPILAIMTDQIEQAHWLSIISQRLMLPQDSLTRTIAKYNLGQTGQPPTSPKILAPLSVKEQLLALFEKLPAQKLAHPDLYNQLKTWYTDQVDELVLRYDHWRPAINQVNLATEFDDIFHRYALEERELIKQNFAADIASAESLGDRKKAKELVGQLMKELENKK